MSPLPQGLGETVSAAYSQAMGLLERDAELGILATALADAAAGTGTAIAVSGEPGAGKSVLVEAACAAASGLRVVRGGCDPLGTPRPLGPFRDMLPEVAALAGSVPLSEVCEASYAALRAEPTVLVVEDLHWVDEASVEVLRFLIRRSEAMPCVVLVTYRGDEIDAQHPARPLLGDFAVLDQPTTLRLAPLSVTAVAELVAGTSLDAEKVHAITGGNAFFACEVAKEPDLPLPETVRDAILARTTGIAPEDFEVLQLAATAPERVDDRLLPALDVALPTLRRLHATGLLTRNQHGLLFRHELARLAVESTIPAGGLARLHGRLLDALERMEGRDPAILTHHAVAAADSARVLRYAPLAAEEAARTGSHTEAAAFFQTALQHLAGEPRERAKLLMSLASEQYMSNRLQASIDSITASFALWEALGDAAGLSAAHEMCAVFEYYNSRRVQAEQHAERATSLAGSRSALEYGVARLTRGYLAFQRSEYDITTACNLDGDRVGHELAHDGLLVRTGVLTAATDLAQGRGEARERLVGFIEQARERHLDELASTGYSNLSYLDVEQRRLQAAERVLEESIGFTAERDILICNHWQTGVRSRLRFLEGRWNAALEDADDTLARSGMPVATLWPLLVSGLVALRRTGSDDGHLDQAWELAERLDEPLRRLPVLSAFAERWWLTGTPDPRVVHAATMPPRDADAAPTAWVAGDLAVWLHRLGLEPTVPVDDVAEPYRHTLTGRHDEAASWWHHVGSVFEEAMAYADAASPTTRIRGIERLDILGATATADRLRRGLREEGIEHVPPRPRASTQANPAGLTNRQLDVAKLVARGFTNAEIAERLFISVKTADHHVSAVLMKLGLPNRRAVVVQAAELGLS